MSQVDESIQRVIDTTGEMLDAINTIGPEHLDYTNLALGLQAALSAIRTLAAAVQLEIATR